MSRPHPALVALLVLCLPGLVSAQLRARVYASGFTLPVAFVQDPTDRATQYVVEQGGRIRTVVAGAVQPTDFLDLRASISATGERGLLGLAFAPDYAASGRFFVNFTDPNGNTVIARFKRSGNPRVADPASRFDLRWGGAGGAAFITQPFANHNGGNLAFGPDGFLYIGMGDGGSGNDPNNYAQTPGELLGKMLRVDVGVADNDPVGYQVPASNPFVSSGPAGTRPEIWAFGLRNPWRYSFDSFGPGATGALVIADVGQGAWEEVDYEPAGHGGRNYGWRNREGAHDNVLTTPPAYTPLTEPIHEYDHTVGQSITGGFVYRGRGLGARYRGRYFFADFSTGRIWSLGLSISQSTGEATAAGLVEHTAELTRAINIGNISAFGVDAAGELYIVSYSGGQVVRILGAPRGFDLDADSLSDPAVYRPSTGTWFWLKSSASLRQFDFKGWGVQAQGDVPAPGDFDGDGVTDLVAYRPGSGTWFVLESSSGYQAMSTIGWGLPGDILAQGDYDGDGRADAAIFRPSTGQWYIRPSSNPQAPWTVAFGQAGDQPVPADFDGDGKTDIAVYRPSTGTWFVLTSTSSFTQWTTTGWGVQAAGDTPVPADYDGDGKADITVYRKSTGTWFLLRSSSGNTAWSFFGWGVSTDVPVPGDYDGDGLADGAVFRPSTGQWFVRPSSNPGAPSAVVFGTATDAPLQGLPVR
jgi:glucose/arabinose dehydrogenase